MSKIYIPAEGPESWRTFLADPEKQWRDGFSAKEAAYSWESAAGLPEEISTLFGTSTELLLAIPEHKVDMPARGLPSQCDVFALVRFNEKLVAMAVEAKVAESFGEPVGKWLAKGGQNRAERVAGICALLEIETPPNHIRYQLLHRTAAAVVEARRFNAGVAAMVVQSFSPEHKWYEDYAAFCDHLGVGSKRGVLHQRILADGLELALGWASSTVRA
jgi:Domain of unknown function (DUF6946)